MHEQIKEKQDLKANEKWTGVRPSAKQCKKCIHALKDTKFTIGAEKANCDMFISPDDKSPGILSDEVECPYLEE
ncbi:hypothetical protein [Pseudobutyrivibrio sp. C4]|uniref:hypothetical protein n=1 Tax=Pseudobutyrivibrio sp. C4 TaxID=1520803 RepID=UPI000B866EF8|nr:hypothetical protein [Pseudobutyrivibrio sp. C4]